ncbi:MAG: sulfurtransferase [Hydrococcus sp. Prado102]|jgi:thiosulfate/3-mercaptopyruvate sulfurtransferase|nr:sulfurtransferase [Hydrococcus sp. Prado102]
MRRKSLWTNRKKPKFFALLAVAIASIIAIPLFFSPSLATTPSSIQFVSPDWVASNARDPNFRVLDVRTNPLDYITGHLPGAVNIADSAFRGPNGFLPVQYWDNQKLASIFAQSGVSDNSRVLVYSDGRDVLGATMVAYLLERFGVKDIAVLDGGYTGYKALGQPVIKEFPRYTPGNFTGRDNPTIRVALDEVKPLIGKAGVVFIDPRPEELFQGKEDIWVRNGHIPGARNIPWPTFTQANNSQESLQNPHKLKSLDEIRQLLADRGIKPSDDIIVTCSTGREATLQYIVLKHLLGYPKVRIYEGSWTEYSTTDLPVATGAETVVQN